MHFIPFPQNFLDTLSAIVANSVAIISVSIHVTKSVWCCRSGNGEDILDKRNLGKVLFIPLVLFYSNLSLGQSDLVVRPAEVGNKQCEPETLKDLPTIDLRSSARKPSSESLNASEAARQSRYDLAASPRIYDPNSGTESEPAQIHLNRPNNPVPVSISDVVVVGKIVSATGHFSASGTNAFSTFIFQPSTVLKAPQGKPLPESFEVERSGAFVIFPSGHVKAYGPIGLGLPEAQKRYLLFLKRNAEQNGFQIITGYLVTDENTLRPLDNLGPNNPGKYEIYSGRPLTTLIDDINQAVSQKQ